MWLIKINLVKYYQKLTKQVGEYCDIENNINFSASYVNMIGPLA